MPTDLYGDGIDHSKRGDWTSNELDVNNIVISEQAQHDYFDISNPHSKYFHEGPQPESLEPKLYALLPNMNSAF
jgi:hypothetical protein